MVMYCVVYGCLSTSKNDKNRSFFRFHKDETRAMAVCLTLMVGRGSAVIGINVLKRLLDENCEAAFYIFGSVAFGGGLVGFLLPSDAKIKEQKQKLDT